MCLVSFSKNLNFSSLKKYENPLNHPVWLYLEITKRCDHFCPWCYGSYDGKGAHMGMDVFKKVIEKSLQIGVKQVTLSGGEPLLHPQFLEMIELIPDLELHLATNGNALDAGIINHLKQKIRQIQVNFQGSRLHDKVHGKKGAYETMVRNLNEFKGANIETVANITLSDMNYSYLKEIFKEASELEVSRIRVWEATGSGKNCLQSNNIELLFDHCHEIAKSLGYPHVLSYDPKYKRGVHVPCLKLSNKFMFVDVHGQLLFCGAIPQKKSQIISDFKTDSKDKIIQNYIKANDRYFGLHDCPARCL
jgi:MoaA/NifB/PqqE/SkfB family radical SAM enzyme